MNKSLLNRIKVVEKKSSDKYQLLIIDREPTPQERAMYRAIIINDIPKTPNKDIIKL